jgi:GNAT superfamily N-acetyltransferase
VALSVRALTIHDLDLADEIVVAAYNASCSRKDMLRYYLRLQPDGWILVLLDGVPVGLGGLIDYGTFAYLGMMSVHPTAQRKGIGKTLMEHLLAWSDARGCPTVLLDATNAGAQLYKQYGFSEIGKTVSWLGTFKKVPVPFYQSEPLTLFPISRVDLSAVAHFDARYFGADRTRVLTAMLEDYPQRAFLARSTTGEIFGYIYAQANTIGPWVARSPAVAEQLLARILELPFTDGFGVNVALANSEELPLLEHYGFRFSRVLSHMQRGVVAQRDLTKVYGQASFALG